MSNHSRGLLLIEAVLAATVMAVGLVFISRGLSGQLKALSAVESYETLTALARGKLLELEQTQLFLSPPVDVPREGEFSAPYGVYRWAVAATPRKEASGESLNSLVRLTVRRSDRASPAFTLSAVWPTDRVPSAWF